MINLLRQNSENPSLATFVGAPNPADVLYNLSMRVKFYGIGDFSVGMYLDAAAELARNFKSGRTRYKIDDIIELYNVVLFIENGAYSKRWGSVEKDRFFAVKPALYRAISNFFKGVNKKNALTKLKGVDALYVDDFLTLYIKHKIYAQISERQFRHILQANSIGAVMFVRNELAVDKYPDLARSLLMSNPNHAELIITKHTARSSSSGRIIHLPACLTISDKHQLLTNYIESSSPNINYLRLIAEAHGDDGLQIPDSMKLKASRMLESESERIFADNDGISFGYEVSFSESQSEDKIVSASDYDTSISFKKAWFEENLDFPTILNNFIYFFEYADRSMMITLASFKADLGIFERFMGVDSKTEYKKGAAFDGMDMLSNGEIMLYYEFLLQKDIRLEDVISWFFSTNVVEEFGIKGFHVAMPSRDSTYLEKCGRLFSIMESILKQYQYYVTEGEIDQGLVRISTGQIRYLEIPSLSSKKYIYAVKESSEIAQIMRLLFSDQSGLGYINETKNADTFFDLLQANTVAWAEFLPHQIADLSVLKDARIIKAVGGKLAFRNISQIAALNYIFNREALNYHTMSDDIKKEIDSMIKKGYLEVGNTLLSATEADYFNYHLNKKYFGNGLDLKNLYSHDTPPIDSDGNAKIYKHHYMIGLKLIILLLIKLNDEFCAKGDLQTAAS